MGSTYGSMLESGSFKFKVNLYQYCEKYVIAFKNPAYGDLVLHPPPLCALTAPVFLFYFILPEKYLISISKYFSYIVFWLENIFFVVFFLILELLLIPFVYLKNFLTIIL